MAKTSKLLSIASALIMMMSTAAFAVNDIGQIESNQANKIMSLDDLEMLNPDIKHHKVENPEAKLKSVYELDSLPQATTRATNTDPNNALVLPPDLTTGDTFAAVGEQRWYVAEFTTQSKLSAVLLSDTTLDANLYVYKLNQTTMQLELFAHSTFAGLGATDYTDNIVDAGIYYFMIHCASGSGIFNYTIYTSTQDISHEINDIMPNASPLVLDDNNGYSLPTATVDAVIDNPSDFDYYSINLPNDGLYQILLVSPSGKSYQSLWSGDGQNVYTAPDGIYSFSSGINYFGVRSLDGSYSSTDTYSLVVKEVKHATFDAANYIGEWNDITFTLGSDVMILAEKQNVGYFKFQVTAGHRLYVSISNGFSSDEGLSAGLYDASQNLIGAALPEHTVGDGISTFLPLNVNNTSSSTQTYYIGIFKPSAKQDQLYFKAVTINQRIKTGGKTFDFSGTASKSSYTLYSSVLNLDLSNNADIPEGAIFTDVDTDSTQSPSQGNVYHEVAFDAPQSWYRSTVSSSNSGYFNIPNNFVKRVWYFRYYTPATGSSTMRNVSISFDWEYDLALNGYKSIF
ncbi:MAG: hypothetical protein V6Z89_13055 [Desulfobacter sp.]